jgi:hypothetical protein
MKFNVLHPNIPGSSRQKRKVLVLLFIALWVPALIVSCGPVGPTFNSATATAQAIKAQNLATEIAQSLQATRDGEAQQAAATAQAFQVMAQEGQDWPIILLDPFDDNTNLWPEGDNTDALADINWQVGDGKFTWKAKAHDAFVWWVYQETQDLSDFYLAADGRLLSGPTEGEYGLIFRLNEDDDYYLFEANEQGQYAVYIYLEGEWEALIPWTGSPVLNTDSNNHLAVLARGEKFLLFANGKFLDTFTDDRLENGRTGILIGLSNAEDEGTWEFDNFELRSLEGGDHAQNY